MASFENYVAFWFSLDLCDGNSFPLGTCAAASDTNNPNTAGNALLELQFYPPGFPTLLSPISCDSTHWCAALNIDSLNCSTSHCNTVCEEPVNFALIETNGVPSGPPGPGVQTAATFTPDSNTLFMNPADKISVTLKDTSNGLETDVNDITAGTSGFMVASAANQFQHANAGLSALNTCFTTDFSAFSFHPEFSTASSTNIGPWEALSANVNFALETGHFELCGNSSCSTLPDGGDPDDVNCFAGPPVGACFAQNSAGDLDFDGLPYGTNWPDGTASHPSSVVLMPPLSFSSGTYSAGFGNFNFQTDMPASESTCNTNTGAGCTVPPAPGGIPTFYPFYSTTSGCNFVFGNDQPATTNDYSKDSQYGTSSTRFHGDFQSASLTTPTCGKQATTLTTLLSSTPITAGGSASDTATLAGGSSPTGTISFFFSTSNTCPNGGATQVGSPDTVIGNNNYVSSSQPFSTAGTYYWYATYSGDASNNAVTSACEALVVNPVTPSLSTTLNGAPISVGGATSDTATLSGATTSAGGTIKFFFSATNTCPNGGATPVGSPVTVTGNNGYLSSSQVFSTAGTYYWYATYSGDTNNNPVTSACEPLVVKPLAPSLSTVLSGTPIIAGGSASDSATLSGATSAAGGTITFFFSTTNTCPTTGSTQVGSMVAVSGIGLYPSSTSHTFDAAGTYYWYATYSGDANNNAVTSACEALLVNPATPTITTLLSSTSITVGTSVSDTATLAGGSNPTGTVTFFFLNANSCPNGGAAQVGTAVTVTGDGAYPSSTTQTFNTAGTYYWYSTYSGDGNNNGVTSACEQLVVNPVTPTLTTALSFTTITAGGSVSDTATLAGGFSPTGTITFFFSTTNTCPTSGSTQVGSPVTVTGNTAYPSSSQAFSTPGTYYWYAAYSGDSNNKAATSACEPLVVNAATPTLTTLLSSTPITVGGSASDTATLAGGFSPTGTITFFFLNANSCPNGGATQVGTAVTVSGSGAYPSSTFHVFTTAGTYYWYATYSGDANNIGLTSACEPLVVNPATTTLTTLLSLTSINVGGSASDSATLAGGSAPTGTINFFFSTTNTCPNGGATPVGTAVTVSGDGIYPSSTSHVFSTAGTYYWYATYSGDSNNNAVTSACEPLTVNQATPTLTTLLSATTVTLGTEVSDTATLAGGFSPTGTITFFVGGSSTCPNGGAGQVSTPVPVSGNGAYPSVSQLFGSPGIFYWYATYSGDANNKGLTSACEPITAIPKPTPTLTTLLSSTLITVGGSASDTATLAGGFSPTGTITFFFSTSNTCPTTGATQVGAAVTVSGNGAYPSSTSHVFNTAGTYYWYATYSGDSNNNAVTSSCEPLMVNPATPTLTTLLSSTTITVGGPEVSDAATLADGFSVTGTITFFVGTSNTCPNGGAGQVSSPVPVSGNGAYPSVPQVFGSPGTFYWYATYSGDANNVGLTSACEPLTVNPGKATPTLTTLLSSTPIAVGGSASDAATLSGGSIPTGTITFFFSTTNACPTGGPTQVGTAVTVSGNGGYPSSTSHVFSVVGTYYWYATYSGDANNNAVTSACEPLVVNPATPTLATLLSATTVTLGTEVSDTATLAGGFSPTGTITFFLGTSNTCPNGGAGQVSSPVPVSGNGPYPSVPQLFGSPGTFYWYATYSGDSNNNAVTSACEPLTAIAKPTPTLTTTPSVTSETVGSASLKDTAHLAGGFSPTTGTITFTLHNPTSVVVDTETVPVSGNGDYTTPVGYVPVAAGTYQWDASYSGDSNNNAASDVNAGNEQVTVSRASPALTTLLSSTTITVGGPEVSDTATLAGGFSPTGTITFFVSFTNSCPNGSAGQVSIPVPVSGNGAYPSVSQVFGSPGTFYWYATYGGDANNVGLTSACEPLTVNPKTTPTLTTLLSSTPIAVGGSASDSATLAGGSSPTGTMKFFFSTSNTCPNGNGQQVGAADTVSGNGPYSSISQTFNTAGTYYWYATYSGDANNNAVTSACEPLIVSPASPTITTTPSVMSETVGGSALKDITHLAGGFSPTGTITFTLVYNGGPVVDTETVPVSGNGDYTTPVGYVPVTAGTYQWDATYSGDSNNNAARDVNAGNEQVTVSPASPALTTTPTPATEIVDGPALKDIAHLSGGFNPTGTITFTLLSPTSVVADTETVPVSGNGDYTTPVGFVPTTAGTWQWDATYSGDVNNNAAADNGATNERVTVSSTTPGLTTTLSLTTITAGGSASDTAHLSGGFNPTGTMTFYFSSTNTCPNGGATQVGSAVTVSGNGPYASSSQVFSTAGTYYWYATYSGDGSNNLVTSACEPLVVTGIATPTLTTELSSNPITVGDSASDSATLSGGSSPTGTITFFFSTSNTCPTTGATQVGTAVTVSGNGVYTSSSQVFSVAGAYYWYAVYSGDTNNGPMTSACEPLVVQLTHVGVPEFPTPMLVTAAIAFLALAVLRRTRRGSGPLEMRLQASPPTSC